MIFRELKAKILVLFTSILIVALLVGTVAHSEHVHESASESSSCVLCHFHHHFLHTSNVDIEVEVEAILLDSQLAATEEEFYLENYLAFYSQDRAPPSV